MQHSQQRAAGPTLDVERTELSNGLILLLSENHSTPSVSINAIVLAGSRFESDDKAGLASLTGELLDEGTPSRTSEEIAETIDRKGGHLSTFGDYQSSGVVATLLSRDIDLGLDITSDILLNAIFPEEKVVQYVERRTAQIKARLDVPRTLASDIFNEAIFKDTPQHRPAIGYEQTVTMLARCDVEGFYRSFYVPQNTMLAIAGDIDKNRVRNSVEAMFGKWEPAPEFQPPKVPRPERQSQPIKRVASATKEQVNIILGHVGIARRDPDYYALLAMDTILGSTPGFTSRIPRVLRDEQGLAYSTFSNITSSAGLDPGRFIAYIGTAPENLGRAITGLRDEIERIVDAPVTAEELDIAKSYLTGSFVFRFLRNSQIADFLLEAELYGLGFDYLQRYPEFIRSVTIEDISRVARKHIDPQNLTTVVVGPVAEESIG